MADGVFNIAKGKVAGYHDRVNDNDPANSALVLVVLQANEADAVLEDYDDLATLLAAGGNTECTFTNYARKVLTDTDIVAAAVDDTNNRMECDLPDQTFTSAGGATNNTTTKVLICYDPDSTAGTDSDLIPLTHHDYAKTTDGNDMIVQIANYYRAS